MKVLHLQENDKGGKDYVVGDIHGTFGKLKVVLQEIGFDESKDRLFSVGDLVDRGPNSEEALEWLAKPWFFAVRGNHEQMAIDFYRFGGDKYIYNRNGGQWFMDLPKEHQLLFVEAFEKLPIAIDITVGDKKYGIIHSECPTCSWNDLEAALEGVSGDSFEMCAMWSRDKISYMDASVIEDVELMYVGHTPDKGIRVLGNVLYIDTGACFGGEMTVMEIY